MNKLPVGKTILDAYGFAFGQLGTVIGLVWFPLVLSTVLGFLPVLAGTMGDAGTGNVSAGNAGAVGDLAILLLTRLLAAIMCVAVVRQALGLRTGPAIFHFALGHAEFRVFGAMLLMYLASGFYLLLLAEIISLGASVAPVAALAALVGMGLAIYLVIRFVFLFMPTIVCEGRINFLRIWQLSDGNFWRIFAVALAIAVPLWFVDTGCTYIVLGPHDAQALLPPTGNSNSADIERYFLMLADIADRHRAALTFVELILAPFWIGLFVSASAFTYRELAGLPQDRGAITV